MLEGETADVIILSRPVMDELQKQDKFARRSGRFIAGNDARDAKRFDTGAADDAADRGQAPGRG
jgi:hypothetical protein